MEPSLHGLDKAKFDNILEIGAGTGNLTAHLLNYTKQLTSLEIDKRVFDILENRFRSEGNFILKKEDARIFDLESWTKQANNFAICGNLPYYITTDLLIKYCSTKNKAKFYLFLIQKEVFERILAKNNTKNYGPLAIFLQNFFTIEALDVLPKAAFFPAPNVDSRLLGLRPNNEMVAILSSCLNLRANKEAIITDFQMQEFYQFCKEAFMQRRKIFLPRLINLSKKYAGSRTIYNKLNFSELENFWLAYLTKLSYKYNIRIEDIKREDILQIFLNIKYANSENEEKRG